MLSFNKTLWCLNDLNFCCSHLSFSGHYTLFNTYSLKHMVEIYLYPLGGWGVCMDVCTCKCRFSCMYVHAEVRVSLSQPLFTLSFETGAHLSSRITPVELHVLPCLCSLSPGVTEAFHHVQLLQGFWRSELKSPCCKASASPTETSP